MQHEKARCRKRGRSGTCPHKHEVKGVRIAPDMDVVLSKVHLSDRACTPLYCPGIILTPSRLYILRIFPLCVACTCPVAQISKLNYRQRIGRAAGQYTNMRCRPIDFSSI
jgi:hypothetical protein